MSRVAILVAKLAKRSWLEFITVKCVSLCNRRKITKGISYVKCCCRSYFFMLWTQHWLMKIRNECIALIRVSSLDASLSVLSKVCLLNLTNTYSNNNGARGGDQAFTCCSYWDARVSSFFSFLLLSSPNILHQSETLFLFYFWIFHLNL